MLCAAESDAPEAIDLTSGFEIDELGWLLDVFVTAARDDGERGDAHRREDRAHNTRRNDRSLHHGWSSAAGAASSDSGSLEGMGAATGAAPPPVCCSFISSIVRSVVVSAFAASAAAYSARA